MRNSKQGYRAKAFNNKNSFHVELKTLFGDLNSTVNGGMRILAVKYDKRIPQLRGTKSVRKLFQYNANSWIIFQSIHGPGKSIINSHFSFGLREHLEHQPNESNEV